MFLKIGVIISPDGSPLYIARCLAYLIALAIGLAASPLCASQGLESSVRAQALDQIRSTGEIVLAHRESSVPFSFMGPSGAPIGYAVDICQRIALAVSRRLKLPALRVSFLSVSPSSRIEAIEQGKAVLECGSTTNNLERRNRVSFTIPHFITGARMLVRSESRVLELDHIDLKRVVSTKNTTPLAALRQYAKQRGSRFQILEAEDHMSAVQMVELGQADAFIMDDVLLFGIASTLSNRNSLKVVGKFLTTEPLAIMLPKNDLAFKRIVDDEMRRLIFSGELRELYRAWFEKPIPPHGMSLDLEPSYLLKDLWKYPTDKVPG